MRQGQLLGERYRLVHALGRGGMSVVWRARDELLEREVAVKLLAPSLSTEGLATDVAVLDRIRAEARAAAHLSHPNIVKLYDYGETEQPDDRRLPYVVMELVDGGSLSDALHDGPLAWRVAVQVCAEVAEALAVAHACGIVHRDVTPGNVMLTGTGAKLVDFGISAAIGEIDVGPDGVLLGTPSYLAPERLSGGCVQPPSDVYALGLLIYKALTGRLPWQGMTTTEWLAAHRYHDPAPLPPVAGLPSAVVDLTRRCLAKCPDARPSSAEASATLRVAPAAEVAWPWAGGRVSTTGVATESMSLSDAIALPPETVTTGSGVTAAGFAPADALRALHRLLPHRPRLAGA